MNNDFLIGSLTKWATETPDKPLLISDSSVISYSHALEVVLGEDFGYSIDPQINSVDFVLNLLRVRQFWSQQIDQFLNFFPPSEHDAIRDYCLVNPGEISFSSGSTGQPKAIYITHAAQEITAHSINANILQGDRVDELLVLPLSHSSGLGRLRAAILRGATIHITNYPLRPKSLSKAFNTPGPKAMALTPTTWRYIKQLFGETIWERLSNVASIEFGSAPLYQSEINELIAKSPSTLTLMMHYGLTEASRSFIKNLRQDSETSSIGQPFPHVRARLAKVPETDFSELLISGDHTASIVSGTPYQSSYSNPIPSGDIVRFDSGSFFLEGRLKEIVNVGGVKVSPASVESKMASMGISEPFALTGATNELLGEEIVLVTTSKGAEQFETLTAMLKSKLNSSEIPNRVVIVQNLPMLNTSKVDRLAIRELVAR